MDYIVRYMYLENLFFHSLNTGRDNTEEQNTKPQHFPSAKILIFVSPTFICMFHVLLSIPSVPYTILSLVFLNTRFLILYIIYRSAKQSCGSDTRDKNNQISGISGFTNFAKAYLTTVAVSRGTGSKLYSFI